MREGESVFKAPSQRCAERMKWQDNEILIAFLQLTHGQKNISQKYSNGREKIAR